MVSYGHVFGGTLAGPSQEEIAAHILSAEVWRQRLLVIPCLVMRGEQLW